MLGLGRTGTGRTPGWAAVLGSLHLARENSDKLSLLVAAETSDQNLLKFGGSLCFAGVRMSADARKVTANRQFSGVRTYGDI